jgi:hypothetical protein
MDSVPAGLSEALQTLKHLLRGHGYFVHTSGDCTSALGKDIIKLYKGWNLFGWR